MSAAALTRITLAGYSLPLTAPTTGPDAAETGTRAGEPARQGREVAATLAGEPTMIAAQLPTLPVTAGIRYRVRRYVDALHQVESFDPFTVQCASLVQAVQVERVLEAYDESQDRDALSDIDRWDGTAWVHADPEELDDALTFLQRIWALDDIQPAGRPARQVDPGAGAR